MNETYLNAAILFTEYWLILDSNTFIEEEEDGAKKKHIDSQTIKMMYVI